MGETPMEEVSFKGLTVLKLASYTAWVYYWITEEERLR